MPALTSTVSVINNRYGEQAFLQSGNDNITAGEDITSAVSLPAGFGDCLLLEAMLWYGFLSTRATSTNEFQIPGSVLYVVDASSALVDMVATGQFVTTGSAAADNGRGAVHYKPDQPVMWHEVERMFFELFDVVTAGTVSDIRFWFRVRRLRNQGVSV